MEKEHRIWYDEERASTASGHRREGALEVFGAARFDGAALLNLRLHDHVIVGNGSERWMSLAQRGDL